MYSVHVHVGVVVNAAVHRAPETADEDSLGVLLMGVLLLLRRTDSLGQAMPLGRGNSSDLDPTAPIVL